MDTHEEMTVENAAPARRRPWLLPALLAVALVAAAGGLGIGYLRAGGNGEIAGGMPSVPGVTLLTAQEAGAAADADNAAAENAAVSAADALPGSAAPTKAVFGPALPPAQYVAHLPTSYALPIQYGTLGPQLVKAGVIDLPAFVGLYADGGSPLSADQEAILRDGKEEPVVIDAANAHFLLNFFWAVGLANRNPLLLEGPMQEGGPEAVFQFASTGGWTLAAMPIEETYAALPLIELTAAQQARLEAVAVSVYRPCCGNSTAFPDCNHGMAMLGILELMAAQDASEDEMYAAAKYVSAFWFPQEVTEAAAYFKLTQGLDFDAIDPQRLVSRDILSLSGAKSIRQWLADAGRLGQPVQSGGSCGA